MKASKIPTRTGFTWLTGLFALTAGATVLAQDAAPSAEPSAPLEKPHVLLDKVKKSELDRQVAAKQVAIDRLQEDLNKTKKDSDALQKTMEDTGSLINESTEHLNELMAQRKRLQHDLNLTIARIEADGQKIEALRNLSTAQGKAFSALTRQIEEDEARGQLRTAERDLLAAGKLAPGDEPDYKGHPDLLKLKKNLSTAEAKTASEEKIARDAMKAATSKVQAADLAAARVKRMAEEPVEEKPEPVGEEPVDAKAAPNRDDAYLKQPASTAHPAPANP